ncbi:demethylmenaquinone methyltransferase [Aestuariimicrobium soli]|uniref:demethylmenaquinone methyltransferase n=1 Tax=Aestuariimicrobium soli TaxID=2035834 RepID=UPI003EBEC523
MVEIRADLTKRRRDVSAMFDGVAKRYDLLNRLLTFGVDANWRDDVIEALEPRPGERILDLAAGTGASSAPIADAGAAVYCTDLSWGMLAEGHRRHPELTFVAGDALNLPWADDTFDAVTISFGLRNVEDTLAALREMKRVTKPGGRLLICEFSTPVNPAFRRLYSTYLGTVFPLGRRFASNPAAYDYLAESIRAWPDQPGLADLCAAAGWRATGWQNLSGGIVALHRAWAD